MTKIKNTQALFKSALRGDALKIIEAGLSAIDTTEAIRTKVSFSDEEIIVNGEHIALGAVERIFVVGVGKCAITAAAEIEKKLGEKITGGMVIDVRDAEPNELKRIKAYKGTHPMPSEANIAAAKMLVELLSGMTENDLVLCLISGGGSTLLCLPEEGYRCFDEGVILKELFRAGATIQEINTIRKHMSLVRGGYLAKYAYPARVVSLVFSDVPGNEIAFVASGPTVKDMSIVADADMILEKFNILRTCGMDHCGLIETPKEDKYFERVTNVLFISNETALSAMRDAARASGYHAEIVDTKMSGEARDIGRQIAEKIVNAPAKSALLYGGETTVTILHEGRGGRSLELALGALAVLDETSLVAPVASDGRDNTDFAGAVCDILTAQKARELQLDARVTLEQNNSFDFFEKVGDFISTGNTGSNVSDLVLALKE